MQKIILDLIKLNGFITLDDFIFQAMCNKEYGYYATKNPLNIDFTTSPEITNAFGIILGNFIINRVLNVEYIDKIDKVHLCEFGGGTGKLAFDLLNFVCNLNKLNDEKINKIITKINFYSIEFSEKLTEIQKNKLENIGIPKKWFKNFDDFLKNQDNVHNNKNDITIFFSNEFFDALPIKQFILDNNELCEIAVKEENNKFILSKIPINKNIFPENYFNLKNIPNNSVIEFPNIGVNILENIINFIKKNNSMFITFDYGFLVNNYQNTVQGIFNGEKNANILENIGNTDITHLVNFDLFKDIFQKNQLNCEIKTQGDFLIENGIENLINEKNQDGIFRILEKNQMGELFKVLYCENL